MIKQSTSDKFLVNLKPAIFVSLVALSVLAGYFINIPSEWLIALIPLFFAGIFLREKYTYIIAAYTAMVIIYLLQKNVPTYNLYFKMLIAVIILGLLIELVERLARKILNLLANS